MANQPGIVIYRQEYASVRGKLSREQKGELLDALMDFSETGEEYQGGDPYVSMAFSFFSAAIRRSAEKYERRRKANQENIEKRWHTDDDDPNTNDTNGTDGIPTIPMETTKPNESKPIEANRKPNRNKTVFVPPTIEEVAAYCRERGNGIDAEAFVSHYAAQGWVLGSGQKMKDWKMAVIKWEIRRKEGWKNGVCGTGKGDRVEGQRDLYES